MRQGHTAARAEGWAFPGAGSRALRSWCFYGQWPRSGTLSLAWGQKKEGKDSAL